MAINNRPAPTAADKLVAAELVNTSYNEPTTAPTRLSIKDKLFRLKKVGNLQDQNDDENQFKVGKNSIFLIRGRSQTTLTRFCTLLTTYVSVSIVDICEGIPLFLLL